MSRFKSIIIVTYGRSGSTLLQEILNSMPGFLVRDENYNFTEGLFIAARRFDRALKKHATPQQDRDNFNQNVTKLLRDMLVSDDRRGSVDCYGFREIRYPAKPRRFADYIAFLRTIMPELAVIINTRNHDDVAASGWWTKRPKAEVVTLLSKNDANFAKYAKKNDDHAFHIRYEDVCENGARLQALYAFLGVPYSAAQVAAILSVRQGDTAEESHERERRRAKTFASFAEV